MTEIDLRTTPRERVLMTPSPVRTLKNLFWLTNSTMSSVLFNMVINFLLARAMGASGYGQFSLIMASCSWVLVLRTAVGSDLIRKSAQDSQFARLVFVPALLGLSMASSLVGLAATGVNFALIRSTDVLLPSILLALGFIGATYSAVPVSLFIGRDRMQWQFAESAVSLFVLVGLVIGVRGGFSLLEVSAIYLVSYMSICLALVARAAWLIRPRLWAGDRLLLKSLTSDVFSLLSVNIIQSLHWSLELYFLQFLQSSAAVGLYNAAYKLVIVFRLAPSTIMMSLIPEVARRASDNDFDFIRRIWVSTTRLFIFLGGALAIIILPLADFIIRVSYSTGFERSSKVLILLTFAIFPLFLQSVTQSLLYAAGRYRDLRMGYGAGLLAQVVLDWLLIPRFGAEGAAGAFALTECVILACLALLGLRRFGLPPLGAIARIALPTVLAIAAVLVGMRLNVHPVFLVGGIGVSYLALSCLFGGISRQDIQWGRGLWVGFLQRRGANAGK